MAPQVISFHYDVKDKSGQLIQSSKSGDPMICLEGARQVLPGLEKALAKMSKGDKQTVSLPAAEAYGEHDTSLILSVPKTEFPPVEEGIKKGHQFQSQSPEGHIQLFTVVDVNDTEVKLDGNHPLAGKDLVFDVEVVGKREATKEELAHGHAHHGDGHHHH